MKLRKATWVVGMALILAGILGFVPGFMQHPHLEDPALGFDSNYGRLLGLFPVNWVHNLIHLGLGVWAVVASKDFISARRFCRFNAVFYGALAVMGLVPGLNTLFGIVPIFGHDVWLHALIAGITGYLGFVVARSRDQAESLHQKAA